jgi:flagellar basal-body rod modification protein FlgD
MPVDSVTSTTTATPSADQISSRSANLDKTDFLQMLTAQLKAQDPMNPLDSQDFAAQLAQFTSVQELQSMSTTLDSILQADALLAQTFSNTMSTSLVGKTIRANVDQISVTDTGSATLNYNLPDAATGITVEIKDSDGTVVRTLTVSAQAAGDQQIAWDGKNSDGTHVPAGDYTYTVSATDADNQAMTVSTYIQGKVSEIRYIDGSPVLMVNGNQVQLGQVISIIDSETSTKNG